MNEAPTTSPPTTTTTSTSTTSQTTTTTTTQSTTTSTTSTTTTTPRPTVTFYDIGIDQDGNTEALASFYNVTLIDDVTGTFCI